MTYQLSQRSLQRLEGVHPDLVRVVRRALERSRYDFVVSEGVRAPERQQYLVAQGYSKTLRSKHLVQSDGYAHAVDLVACGDLNGDGVVDAQDRALVWNRHVYVEIAKAVALSAAELGVSVRHGIDFKGFFDGPHHELATT
jgi:peptidoglycan LD-endopeptidase CwlK